MTTPRARTERRPLHGVLLLDKPVGQTSNHALQQARRLYRAEKAGHTGTLDPLASGLLPICFGAATKFAQASLEADKRYRATLALGARTASGDRETPVVERCDARPNRTQVEAVCRRFSGEIDQLPPMHSALKHDGRALYTLARAGREVERAPRRVRIDRLDVVSFDGTDELVLDVHCSKGTYIRTLADDIGRALGCLAHLAALRRTGSGAFDIAGATTIDELQTMDDAQRDARLLAADTLLAGWPEIALADDEAARFLTGLRRRVVAHDAPAVRVYAAAPRAFLGSAHVAGGELIADRLLSPLEVQACDKRAAAQEAAR